MSAIQMRVYEVRVYALWNMPVLFFVSAGCLAQVIALLNLDT